MKRYRFEIQKSITVEAEAETVEEARIGVIDNLSIYADEMVQDPYISDGVEINRENTRIEYCKYLNKHGTHDEIIEVCKQWHHDGIKKYPCAFFVAYGKEVL